MRCRTMWAVLAAALGSASAADAQRCDDAYAAVALDAREGRNAPAPWEREVVAAAHLPWGIPRMPEGGHGEVLLVQPGYVLSYDVDLRTATWAAYRLTREAAAHRRDRTDCSRVDVRLAGYDAATVYDYAGPVFERGRLVPSADMPRDPAAVASTELLSNGVPQYPRFRAGIWARLERYVRAWARTRGTVHVITGAIFDRDGDGRRDADDGDVVQWMPPTELVAVPSAYFKIVAWRTGARVETLAIVVPHTDEAIATDRADAVLRAGIRSIDEIEATTGIDFFASLDDAAERTLEAARAPDLWSRAPRRRRATPPAGSEARIVARTRNGLSTPPSGPRSDAARADPGRRWRTPPRGAMAGG